MGVHDARTFLFRPCQEMLQPASLTMPMQALEVGQSAVFRLKDCRRGIGEVTLGGMLVMPRALDGVLGLLAADALAVDAEILGECHDVERAPIAAPRALLLLGLRCKGALKK